MEKIISLCIFLLLSVALISPVQGADLLHRLTHHDQETLVIGRITAMDDTSLQVHVMYIVSGIRTSHIITVNQTCCDAQWEQLAVQDTALLSLDEADESEHSYDTKWGLYPLVIEDGQARLTGSESNPDYKALEYYINSGGTPLAFHFENDVITGKYDNGAAVRIAPEMDEAALRYSRDGVQQLIRPKLNDDNIIPLESKDTPDMLFKVTWSLAVLLAVVIALTYLIRRNRML
ncbi:hypothetical protein M3650_15625 [Paenibacillus sp. MER TA 81-3]|uniref:hypothetical protein n=1 Tax=Paenibacillus sp. MER TA 81-3 TaxID=2939573 RepID=UPI002040EF21|nr:hypothetical protein [Paenibacillus sp. MER TA 81-3]MCM3340023.1 hypothetical protein [Paenibacillus sp. MER TA 81-3]